MSKELCRPCGQTFTSTTAGDMHRTGDHAVSVGPNRRRCLTVEEMEARGMVRNQRGHWASRARSAEPCVMCDNTGWSVQGWTDKNGYPEDQYGPCMCGRDPNTPQNALPVEARNDEQDGRGGLAHQMTRGCESEGLH